MNVIGNPVNPYQQQYSDTCAIKSQQLILNEFGLPVTEDQLVQYSMEHGWYTGDGSGTLMSDIGKLLADAGIPCTQRVDANVFDLTSELAQGHKVIVGVDSAELWNDNWLMRWIKDLFNGDTPDHALIVAGIDMTNPDEPMVILTDPGTGEPAEPYPLDKFMDAWSDSSHFMVSTDVPTPAAVEMFTQMGGEYHLPEIAGVDYETFDMFHTYSNTPDLLSQIAVPDPVSVLYDAFRTMPTMPDMGFNDVLAQFGLPSPDSSFFAMTPFVDPLSTFNYNMFGQSMSNPFMAGAIDSGDAMTGGLSGTAHMSHNQTGQMQHDMSDMLS